MRDITHTLPFSSSQYAALAATMLAVLPLPPLANLKISKEVDHQ